MEQVLALDDMIRFHPYLGACKPKTFYTRKSLPVSRGTEQSTPQKDVLTMAGIRMPQGDCSNKQGLVPQRHMLLDIRK